MRSSFIVVVVVLLATLVVAPNAASAEGLWPGETKTHFLHRPQLVVGSELGTSGLGFRIGGRLRWIELTAGVDLAPFTFHDFGGLKVFATPDEGATAYAYGRAGTWVGETRFSESDRGDFGAFGVGVDYRPFWHVFVFAEGGTLARRSDEDHEGLHWELDVRGGLGLRF
jgi:hypothetical protein